MEKEKAMQQPFMPEEVEEIRTLALDAIRAQRWSTDFVERIVKVIESSDINALATRADFCPQCHAGRCGHCGHCHLIYPLTGVRCPAYRDTILGCWEWKEAFVAINKAITIILDP